MRVDRAKVYWNFRRHLFSVQVKGKVIAHCTSVFLENVQFKVSEAGRQRVLREQRKNVHAYIIGTLVSDEAIFAIPRQCVGMVRYNPYKHTSFVVGEHSVHSADRVICSVQNRQPVVASIDWC